MTTLHGNNFANRCIIPTFVSAPGQIHNGIHLSGLIDTGASQSAITVAAAQFVSLPVSGENHVMGSGMAANASTYAAHVELWSQGPSTEPIFNYDQQIFATMLSAVVGFHLLIGMDILSQFEFEMSSSGTWSLSR